MAEQSKLVDLYNAGKTPFSKIGQKMDNIIKTSIPANGKVDYIDYLQSQIDTSKTPKIQPFSQKDLDIAQANFHEIVVKPFSTILAYSSQFGKINVIPYSSLMDMITKLNEPAPSIIINSDAKLLRYDSPYGNITIPSNASMISLNPPGSGKTVPVTFTPDLSNTGFTVDSKLAPMTTTPEKFAGSINTVIKSVVQTTQDIIPVPPAKTMPFAKLGVMKSLPTYTFTNPQDAPTPPDKLKQSAKLTGIPGGPDKTAIEPAITDTPLNSLLQQSDAGLQSLIVSNPSVYNASSIPIAPLSTVQTPGVYHFGFITNTPFEITQYRLDNIFNNNTFKLKDATLSNALQDGDTFATFAQKPNTIYGQATIPIYNSVIMNNTPEAFDFARRTGVMWQFDAYTNKYYTLISSNSSNLSLGNLMSFTTWLDILNKKITYAAPGKMDIYTPKYAIGNALNDHPGEYRFFPPNQSPSYGDNVSRAQNGGWFNDKLRTLGAGLAGSALNGIGLQAIQQISGFDTSLLQISALGLDVAAGNVYYSTQGYESILASYKTPITGTDTTSGILSGIQSIVKTGMRSIGNFQKTFNIPLGISGDVTTTDGAQAVSMVAQILAGTRYTTAYAFYDPTAKYYSSMYNKIGDTAVNLYGNDGTQIDSKAADSVIKYGSIKDSNFALSILSRYSADILAPNATFVGSTISGPPSLPNIPKTGIGNLDVAAATVKQVSDTFGRILGGGSAALVNPVMQLKDSITFGVLPSSLPPINITLPGVPKILNITLPGVPKILGNSLQPSQVANVSNTAQNPHGHDFATFYSGKMKSKLQGENKLLVDRGIPDISANFYKDSKNMQDLASLPIDQSTHDVSDENMYKDTDLIDFYFEDVTSHRNKSNVLIAFRALISSYADSTTADWQTQMYVGRADKFYIYTGFDRKIGITFDVAINSSDEVIPIWRKLNYLQGMMYPVDYPGGVPFVSPIVRVTVGNLIHRVYGVIGSINFNLDESTIWETTKNFQLPMYARVTLDFNVLYDAAPKNTSNHFAQNSSWISTTDKKGTPLNAYVPNNNSPRPATPIPQTATPPAEMSYQSIPTPIDLDVTTPDQLNRLTQTFIIY